jgi:flagellar protein FlgJ
MSDQIPFSSVPFDTGRMPTTPSSVNKDSSRLEQACSELESLFIYYLMKEMRASVPKSGFIGGGKAEEMYTSMLDLQMSKEIASEKEIGISSALLEQLRANMQDISDRNNKNSTENE